MALCADHQQICIKSRCGINQHCRWSSFHDVQLYIRSYPLHEALRLREDRRDAIAALDMPVLYLCGAEDTLCPPAWHQIWTDMTPKAQFSQISGAGHMVPLEAPKAFAATIGHWLTINEKDFA